MLENRFAANVPELLMLIGDKIVMVHEKDKEIKALKDENEILRAEIGKLLVEKDNNV